MAITLTRPGPRAHAEGMPENRPDPEVPAKAQRRRHGVEYKLQILEDGRLLPHVKMPANGCLAAHHDPGSTR